MAHTDETVYEVDRIQEILDLSRQQNLKSEVVIWALWEMKEDPKLKMVEALEIAFDEWIK